MLCVIMAGGGLGAGFRAALGHWIASHFVSAFPTGTFVVNVIGSFVIGLISVIFADRVVHADWLRLFLMTGLLGGFTTFSSFSFETVQLIHNGRAALAATYIAASVILCVGGAMAGIYAARTLS
jgi:CrcB protein